MNPYEPPRLEANDRSLGDAIVGALIMLLMHLIFPLTSVYFWIRLRNGPVETSVWEDVAMELVTTFQGVVALAVIIALFLFWVVVK